MDKIKDLKVGDFIMVPAWNVTGCIVSIGECELYRDRVTVLLQTEPGSSKSQAYHLKDSEFEIV